MCVLGTLQETTNRGRRGSTVTGENRQEIQPKQGIERA